MRNVESAAKRGTFFPLSRRHIHRGFLFGKKIDQQSHAGNACSLGYGLGERDASGFALRLNGNGAAG